MFLNLRSFKLKVRHRKTAYKRFLTRLEKNTPKALDTWTTEVEKQVWKEVDCLACANCCKSMTPTYTGKDMKRISKHLGMSVNEFKKKWLKKDRSNGDWMNKSTPCQFLNLKDNKCSIYEVRPADCAGFPHLPKKKMVDYMHVHKQNIEYCPATFTMVEKIMDKFKETHPPA